MSTPTGLRFSIPQRCSPFHGEREKQTLLGTDSLNGDSRGTNPSSSLSPRSGERVRERGSFYCIDTALCASLPRLLHRAVT